MGRAQCAIWKKYKPFQGSVTLKHQKRMVETRPGSNQIYLVTLRPTQLTQASFLQKKMNVAKCFFDIFNAEIAQCRQKLDVIFGTKVVQFLSYQKMYFTKNVVLN